MKKLIIILLILCSNISISQSWKEMIAPAQFGLTDEQEFTILENNRPVLATITTGPSEPKVYIWDGANWQQMPQIVAVPVTDIEVTHHGTNPIVGFYNTISSKYEVYVWDGSNWNLTGDTGVIQYHPGTVRLVRSANPPDLFISYSELGSQEANMKKWNGTFWTFHGASFDPGFGAIDKISPGSQGSKIWAFNQDPGNAELRMHYSDEFSPAWVYYTNTVVASDPIFSDLAAIQGQFPLISYVTSGSPDDIIVRQADGGFFTDFTPVNVPGGVDEIGCALDDSNTPYIYCRESGSTEGKVFKDGGGIWSQVGTQPANTNGIEGDLEVFGPSGKPYLKYKTDSGEPRLTVYNKPPIFSFDSGINSICQDANGASVFSAISFDDSDNDSLFIVAVSNTPALLQSANIFITRTNAYDPFSMVNDFKIDATPEAFQSGSASVDLLVIDGLDTLTYPITIVVNPAPTVSAGGDQTTCEGTSVTLNGSGASTYVWDNSVSDGIPFTTSAGTTVYTVIGTDLNGCSGTDNMTLTTFALPTFSVNHTNITCNGANDGTITYSGLTPLQNYNVSYTMGSVVGPTSLSTNGAGEITISGLGAGAYSNFTVLDVNGCTFTVATGLSIIEPSVLLSIPISNQFICDGAQATLIGTATGGTSPYTYTWDNGVIDATPFTPSVGTLTYNLTITDANGCTAIDNTDITVYALPSISAGGDITACETDMVTLNGSGGISYTWDNGVSDGIPFTVSVGSTVYTVTGTDGNGCMNTDAMTVTATTLPTVYAGADQSFCENDLITLNGTGALTYTWDNSVVDGVPFNQLPGVVTYTTTGTDVNGCTNTDNVIITVYPAPPAFTVSPTNPTICGNFDGSLLISGLSSSTTYDLTYLNPSLVGPLTLTSDPAGDITLGGLNANSYSDITVIDGNGCTSVSNGPFNLSDPAAPSVNAGLDVSICEGESTLLLATNPDNALISWNNFALDGALVSPASTTTYTVTASSSGCTSTDQITVTVLDLPDISVAVSNATCGSADGAANAIITNGLAPYTIYWSNGGTGTSVTNLEPTFYYINVTDDNGCYAMDVAPISSTSLILSGTVTDNLCYGETNGTIDLTVSGTGPFTYHWSNGEITEDLTNLEAGQYEVQVIDGNGCHSTASFVIQEPSKISANYTSTLATCGSADATITATVIGGTTPYSFQWNDFQGNVIAGQINSTLPSAEANEYTLQITDVNGCTDEIFAVVSELNGPIVSIDSLGASTCSDDGYINVNINSSFAITSTTWSSGQTNEDLTSIGTGTYTITVEDANGCKGLLSVEVPPVLPSAVPICIVGVDTTTNTNIIVWEKPISNNIDHFKVYRESSIAGKYHLVDTVNYASLSIYNDTIAYASLRSWRYILTTVDTCGIESLPSEDHKTIHITKETDGLGNYTLHWDAYEGFVYSEYSVWRFTSASGWVEIDQIPFTTTVSYPDTPPSELGLDYMIVVTPPSVCTATTGKASDYNSSRSNRTVASGIVAPSPGASISSSQIQFSIYPNPSSGLFLLTVEGADSYDLSIFDLSGKLILNQIVNTSNYSLDLVNYADGTYLLHIQTEHGVINKQIIKN